MKMKRLFVALAALIAGGLILPTTALAQTCGLNGSPATATTASYDPFNPAGLGTTSVTLKLDRFTFPTIPGRKTDAVRFILKGSSAAADGTTVVPISAAGAVNATGLNLNIFYNFASTTPTLTGNPTAANRFLLVEFTGANPASDDVTVTFNVTLPANLDLASTSNLAFDLVYTCTTTGGGAATTGGGTLGNAVTFPIKVLSALQASYVGAALDFGEVGDKTTADVLLAPATYSTSPAGNNVRVLSSGPYKVEMASQNAYRLTFPSGDPGEPLQRLNYKALFLGQTVSNAAPTFTAVTCARAGVPASEADLMPIRATLLEGGDGKQLSPDYKDVITVTVSPLAVGPLGVDCPALVLPSP